MSAAILLSFGFGQIFKWSKMRSYNAPLVVSTNHVVLATLLGGYYLIQGELVVTLPIQRVGAITGRAHIASMLAMIKALERGQVAPVLTAFRLSILVPVVAGILVWDERANAWQTLGIVAAIISMILMACCKSGNSDGRSNMSTLIWVLLVFLMQGLVNCGNR